MALVNELLDEGLSRSKLARYLGVRELEVKKMRLEDPTGEVKDKLLTLVKLVEELSREDKVSWLDVPLVEGYTLTGWDVVTRKPELVDTLRKNVGALDEVWPEWRDEYWTNFKLVQVGDERMMVSKSRAEILQQIGVK